jgi:ribosomal protein S18 acetylase RimI-like enzyme
MGGHDSTERLGCRWLGEGDRRLVLEHFLALGAPDRQRRFHALRSNEALARYVLSLDLTRVILIGVLDGDGTLVGLAEAHLDDPARPLEAEISVSVLEGWRRAGLGRRLVAGALACAFARGAARATLVFTPDNQPMVRLLRSLGGRIETLRGRATFEQPLPQAA